MTKTVQSRPPTMSATAGGITMKANTGKAPMARVETEIGFDGGLIISAKVADEEQKPDVPTNIYVYSPIGKRDPFQDTNNVAAFSLASDLAR